MKVTNVSLRETEAAAKAGRPALTPELLAASGARYSRSNEGLEAILSKIDPDNLDKSVDSIFRMIDYGHQSIADMAPVAMFMDGVSIFLAYLVWSWCPTAGGQESSTRYIKLDRDGLVAPDLLGVPREKHGEWFDFMGQCFDAYGSALEFWEKIGSERPELTRIPATLLNDPSEKAQKQVARMKRNYAFDRARYFLPVAAKTNMMLIMSARGWVQLCQHLLSHWLPEANLLGSKIRDELTLSAPRMVKHAERKESFAAGQLHELHEWAAIAAKESRVYGEHPCEATVEVFLPPDASEADLVASLQWRDNRYAFVGSAARRTGIRFAWSAVSIAEIRDLNRHRTGQKHCPLVPVGFYCAKDQVPATESTEPLPHLVGEESLHTSHRHLGEQEISYIGWLLLGSQFRFEHTTTLDKFIYEAELRTGTGAHYRYASHLHACLGTLRRSLDGVAASIRTGKGEPE